MGDQHPWSHVLLRGFELIAFLPLVVFLWIAVQLLTASPTEGEPAYAILLWPIFSSGTVGTVIVINFIRFVWNGISAERIAIGCCVTYILGWVVLFGGIQMGNMSVQGADVVGVVGLGGTYISIAVLWGFISIKFGQEIRDNLVASETKFW